MDSNRNQRQGWSVSTTVAGNYVLAMRCCPWRQRHWMCDLILKRTRTEVMLAAGDLILRIPDSTTFPFLATLGSHYVSSGLFRFE